MTAPTNKERREVAARLREARDSISFLPNTPIEQIAYDAHKLILACAGYKRGNIFDILADLIDPTCTAPLGEHEHGWLTRECSECGYTIKTCDKYCSNCGARVVS